MPGGLGEGFQFCFFNARFSPSAEPGEDEAKGCSVALV